MLLYLKALHIIFIVTWFAGLFYMPRLLIYNTEAGNKPDETKKILREQFGKMMKPLWFGITWPSAVFTLILGLIVMFKGGWADTFRVQTWLHIKLTFVFFLYLYHFSLHILFRQQMKGFFNYSSQQLRIWNEVATIFLVAIVMLVVVKQNMSFVWGILGLLAFVILLMAAIKIYKIKREKK
ncbi:MAG: CopD family protein [Bacteroidota bacterium]